MFRGLSVVVDVKLREAEATSFDVATVAYQGARNYQEDSIISHFPLGQTTGFAVLADGMGGHEAGNVASALVMSEVFAQLKINEAALDNDGFDIPAALKDMAQDANARIIEYIEKYQETYGMGTTLLATLIHHDKLYWVSVGDSPLFLFRDGVLSQLNKDHSMAPQIEMMVKVGAMTEEMGRNHPDRNTLTSAISGQDIALIDCPSEPTTLKDGDILIASSDGLQFLSNEDIAATITGLRDQSGMAIANALLTDVKTLDHPEQDNTAFTVVKLDRVCAQAEVQAEIEETTVVAMPAPDDADKIEELAAEADDVAVVAETEEADNTDADNDAEVATNKPTVVVVEAEPMIAADEADTAKSEEEDTDSETVGSSETVTVAPIEKNGRRTIKVIKKSEPRQRFIPKRPSDPNYASEGESADSTPNWYRKQKRFKD